MDKLDTVVILPHPIREEGVAYLRENVREVIVAEDPRPETVLRLLNADVGGLLLRMFPFGKEMFEAAPNLKVLSRHGNGYDNIDMAEANRRGVLVVNSPDAATDSVAEHAAVLTLMLCRKMYLGHGAIVRGRGTNNSYAPEDAAGKSAGIIGLGRIGMATARRLHAFGMKILVYARHKTSEEIAALGYEKCDTMDELLQRADFVLPLTPLTPETRHLLGAAELSRMKPTAYVVNCSRGAVIDEAALIEALRRGQIAGAGLDVMESEPLSTDSPLISMENVILTPHVAAITPDSMLRMAMNSARQLVAALRGEPVWSPVNLQSLAPGGNYPGVPIPLIR